MLREGVHNGFFFRALHFSVQQTDAKIGKNRLLKRLGPELGGFERLGLAFFDGRADDIRLTAERALLADEGVDARTHVLTHKERVDRLTAGRKLTNDGNVKIAVSDERERARDGRCGHDEQMRLHALGGERRTLGDAEAVLLVGDDKTKLREGHIARQKRVRANDELRLAGGDGLFCAALLRRRHGAGQEDSPDRKMRHQRAERGKVLLCENFGRRQKRGLISVLRGAERRGRGDHRLSASDVALHKAVHGVAGGHVAQHITDRVLLRGGQPEGKHRGKHICAGDVIRTADGVRAGGAQALKPGGEDEKFLKHKARARTRQRVPAFGRVDRLVGGPDAAEAVFASDLLGQNVGEAFKACIERLTDCFLQNGAGEPRRERVDGDEPPGDAAGALYRLKNRIEHLAVRFERERSEETVGLTVVKRGGKIGLVKKGEGELSAAVGDGQARDVKTLADVRGFGACDDHCLKACGNARLERADLGGMRAVFVGAREIGNEVVERPDGQPLKLRRAGGLDAGQSGHGRCERQRLHPKHHLSGRIQEYFNA